MKNRKNGIRPILILCIAGCFLSGCAMVGPDYKRHELERDSAYADATAKQLDPNRVIRPDWWKNFNDPALDQLVADAIKGSYDLKILLGKIKVSGALVDQSEAELYPSLGLETEVSISDSKTSGSNTSYNAKGLLNWELDLWGKNRRKVAAEKAEAKAVKADYRAGYLTLVADVARAYFSIRQYDRIEKLTRAFIRNNELVLSIYQQQYREGIVGDGKVLRQRAQVNNLRQELLELIRGRKIQTHKIAALLGRPPGKITIPADPVALKWRLPEVPVGLPSDLLNRRPDILAAEYRLLKASHEIGVAEADRLPSISLTMEGGLTSQTLATLLSGGMFSLMPKISLPIFDAGRRKAEVERRKYKFEIARNEWAKTVYIAFQEVADALTNLSNRKKQLAVLKARVSDLKRIRSQINARLKAGLVSQLEFYDIEDNLYSAEKEKIKMEMQLISDTIVLYKALGGGWPSVSEDR